MLNSDDFLVPAEIDKLYYFTLKNKLDLGYGKMAIKKKRVFLNIIIQVTKKNLSWKKE